MKAKELADVIRNVYSQLNYAHKRTEPHLARFIEDLVDALDAFDPPTGGGHDWEEGTFASLNWEIRLRHCKKCGRVEFFESAKSGWKKWFEGITEEEDACRDKDADKK